MLYGIRTSGLDIIGDIPWGTHICQLYESKEDIFNLMVPFIKAGLENNELCLWIYGDNTSYEEIKSKVSGYINGTDKYIDDEKLLIMLFTEWYLEDNCFKEVRVNGMWSRLAKYTADRGFDGLRVVADAGWISKKYCSAFMKYENNANNIMSESPFIAVCLYDVNNMDVFEVANVMRNHSYIITKHEGTYEIIKNMELLVKEKQLLESRESL